jgi:hypothetical protein
MSSRASRPVAPPMREGAKLTIRPPVSAQEWGRRKAAESPQWSSEKWHRVAAIFGAELADDPAGESPQKNGRDAA